MSTQDQARALMTRHHHLVKHRQQALLGRAMSEAGLSVDNADTCNHIQGKAYSSFSTDYDRSRAALS